MLARVHLLQNTIATFTFGAIVALSVFTLDAPAAYAGATNLLTNGDFSICSGTPSGWTTSGMGCDGFSANQTTLPAGATNWISTGGPGSALQTFSDVSGAIYTVDGWIKLGSAQASVAIDSATVITAGNSSDGSVDWTQYTGTFRGTGSDTIDLTAPNFPGYVMFTAFSVTSPVPEPATLSLLGLSVSVLGIAVLRRSRLSEIAAKMPTLKTERFF